MRVEVLRSKGEGPGTVIIRKHGPGKDEAGKDVEILTEDVGPGTVVIRKKVDGKEVVEKRVKVLRKEGGTARPSCSPVPMGRNSNST
ncbi:MAG: hypothetical protein IPP58_12115 [Holophagaceae bacterium]|uniref:Uncharacterized protein n=1 Tax=Candidatus Geothrix skivensis TaxID=2954439 RepID=A0A9D7SJ59_9BACT|nr:hypothetical protein [Candidatus Geothrix skivensis]